MATQKIDIKLHETKTIGEFTITYNKLNHSDKHSTSAELTVEAAGKTTKAIFFDIKDTVFNPMVYKNKQIGLEKATPDKITIIQSDF